jgi:hypothetical protein
MRNIFELIIAIFLGLILLISLPVLMINDATAIIDQDRLI